MGLEAGLSAQDISVCVCVYTAHHVRKGSQNKFEGAILWQKTISYADNTAWRSGGTSAQNGQAFYEIEEKKYLSIVSSNQERFIQYVQNCINTMTFVHDLNEE